MDKIDIDALAQEIRRIDGNNSLGAGALAEGIAAYLAATTREPVAVKGKPLHEYRQRGQCNCGVCLRIRQDADIKRSALVSTPPAAPTAPVVREFTNELGNRIKITIEGPTSTSENILTPMEFDELRKAIAVPPAPAAIDVAIEADPDTAFSRQILEDFRKAFWRPTTANLRGSVLRSDVEAMLVEWQNECNEFPMIYNQGNVLRDRLASLKATQETE